MTVSINRREGLSRLGHVVDTAKYEGDAFWRDLRKLTPSSSAARQNSVIQIDAGAAGNLKLIIRGGVGVDNINVDYAKEKGIEVRNTPAA